MVGSWRLDQVVMAVAALVTIASAVEYLMRFGRVVTGPGR
jgi:hypothetical protein